MNKCPILFFSLLGILSFSACQASENDLKTKKPNYSATYLKCTDEAVNPNHCIEQELKVQDTKLNIAYHEARKSIQPFRVDALKEMQRAWIKYRDKKCGFFQHKQSGSSGVTDALQCTLDETIHRTKELENLY